MDVGALDQCDLCHRRLGVCCVIGGTGSTPRKFCNILCYDKWKSTQDIGCYAEHHDTRRYLAQPCPKN